MGLYALNQQLQENTRIMERCNEKDEKFVKERAALYQQEKKLLHLKALLNSPTVSEQEKEQIREDVEKLDNNLATMEEHLIKARLSNDTIRKQAEDEREEIIKAIEIDEQSM